MIHRYSATIGKDVHQVTAEPLDGTTWRVTIDGVERVVDARQVGPGAWSILPPEGGRSLLVQVDTNGADTVATVGTASYTLQLADPRRAITGSVAARGPGGPQAVRAPMPGKVIKVLCKVGDSVTSGQGLVVVEAMKMENELRAPRDGKVAEIRTEEGQTVEPGQVLVSLT